jgi:hypothetical protein
VGEAAAGAFEEGCVAHRLRSGPDRCEWFKLFCIHSVRCVLAGADATLLYGDRVSQPTYQGKSSIDIRFADQPLRSVVSVRTGCTETESKPVCKLLRARTGDRRCTTRAKLS